VLLEGTSPTWASELTDITAVASPAPSLPELEVSFWNWEEVYEMAVRCSSGDSTEIEITLKHVPVRFVHLSPIRDKDGTAFLYRYTEVPGKGHLVAPGGARDGSLSPCLVPGPAGWGGETPTTSADEWRQVGSNRVELPLLGSEPVVL